jgi:PAS domain S-box-containing protein
MKLSTSIKAKRGGMQSLRWAASLIFFAILSVSGYTIWSDYRDDMAAAEISAQNHARVLQVQWDASLRRLGAILNGLSKQIPEQALSGSGEQSHGKAVQALLDDGVSDFAEVIAIRVVDAGGDVRYSSPYTAQRGFNSSAHDFFIEPRSNSSPHLFFSKVVTSRITGKQTMVVSRAMHNAKGAFLGVVTAGISIEHFQNQFRKLNVGKNGSIALRRADNLALVVRWPHLPAEVNKPLLPANLIAQRIARGEKQFTVKMKAQTDGVVRIFGNARLEQFPFFVTVAYDVNDVLTNWRRQALMVGFASLSMFLVLLVLLRRYAHSQENEITALQNLAQNQARVRLLARVFENSGEAILLLDQQERILEVNLAFTRLTGYTLAELGQRQLADLLHPCEQSVGVSSASWSEELLCKRKDGSSFPVLHTRASLLDEAGELTYIIINLTDITERKRVEQMKSEFVSTVSHELRTPLTSICGGLGLLVGGALGSLPAPAMKILNIAHSNSLRLSVLINDLLDMEKLAAGKMEMKLQQQALMPLLDATLESNQAYAQTHQVRLCLIERADEVQVLVDGVRLQQVLSNLLSNAAKFSPPNSQVEVRVLRQEGMVRVEVQDHGQGVPPEFYGRMFEKFAQADGADTRQHGGTGLGLAISKQIIEQMQGKIGFESVVNQGALFFIQLPIVA